MATDVVGYLLAFALTRPASPAHVIILVVNLAGFTFAGLYRSRLTLSLLDDLPYIFAAVAVGFTIKTTLFSMVPGLDPPLRQLGHAAALLVTVAGCRWLAYAVVRAARRRKLVQHRTIIVGSGAVGTALARSLLDHAEYGLQPVGFVDSHIESTASTLAAQGEAPVSPRTADPVRVASSAAHPATVSSPGGLPLPLLGVGTHLDSVIRRHRIRDVIVAFGQVPEQELVDVLTTCDRLDVEVFLVPRLLELHHVNRDTDQIWGIPVLRRRRASYRRPSWRLKRVLDILFSSAALVLLSPVLALCALAVRCEGGPGIIFRQVRVGRDGRPFQILKFRTLRPANEQESATTWNIKHDDRLGRVGRLMRASSLDELPQLLNILRGDMAVVGPRPERPHFVNVFAAQIPRYTARSRVPAGLTGWAQVHGLRGDTSIHDRARFDDYYVENWSLWLDVKIILRTVAQVLHRQGG